MTDTAASYSAAAVTNITVQYAVFADGLPDRRQVCALADRALAVAGARGGELTVRFVDETESAVLNRRYRGKTGATNVLSFDYRPPAAARRAEPAPVWGDVAICTPLVCREAAAAGKAVCARALHLIAHAVLHLAGYRHDDDESAETMEQLEADILAEFNIDNPYS